MNLCQLYPFAHAHQSSGVRAAGSVDSLEGIPPQHVILESDDGICVAVDLAIRAAVLLPSGDRGRDPRDDAGDCTQLAGAGATVQIGQESDAARGLRKMAISKGELEGQVDSTGSPQSS